MGGVSLVFALGFAHECFWIDWGSTGWLGSVDWLAWCALVCVCAVYAVAITWWSWHAATRVVLLGVVVTLLSEASTIIATLTEPTEHLDSLVESYVDCRASLALAWLAGGGVVSVHATRREQLRCEVSKDRLAREHHSPQEHTF